MRRPEIAWIATVPASWPASIAVAALFSCTPLLVAQTQGAGDGPPSTTTEAPSPQDAASSVPSAQSDRTVREPSSTGPTIRPRLELFVPSIRKLFTELQRSHSGVFFAHVSALLREMAGNTADGVDPQQVDAILARIANWPDTPIAAISFAPDREGRLRWAVRVDWPLQALADRASAVFETDTASELFEGLRVEPSEGRGFVILLDDEPLAYLVPHSSTSSYIASHIDLPFDTAIFTGTEETEKDGASLVLCRLNLAGTEKDSGATFFSSFNIVTDAVYAGRVGKDGSWRETIYIHWPPISGMGAKALFGRVKRTFFVPREAFGAMAFKTLMAPGMLEGIVGFGPQITFDPSGDMEVFGESTLGPIATSIGSEMCVTILPGTGFLPMPDVVVQVRAKRVKKLMDNIAQAAEALNEEFRKREQSAPWHETVVRNRKVVWSDGANRYPGMMMPLVMRPVLFTTTETDAKDKERDFLVVGWTSTSPKRFVRRWLDFSRGDEKKLFLPNQRKTNGQLWLNWKQFYGWLSPYANLAIGAVAQDALLPPKDEVAASLTDATLTIKTRFTGLQMHHSGPIPIGTLVLPTFVTTSVAPDESGGSDLARERLASQRLKVFHHHAKLFKEDIGRWPAELAELDGYIDFAGHPELLRLQLSSRKGWANMFEDIFAGFEKDDQDEKDEDIIEDDETLALDDKLFVIEWRHDSWRLGLAEGTLEHLQELYIDQDGKIHRVEKKPEAKDEKKTVAGERKVEPDLEAVVKQTVTNVLRRYPYSDRRLR